VPKIPSTLEVSRYDGLHALADVSETLDAVNNASSKPSPFASSAFLRALMAHSENESAEMHPMVLIVREGDEVRGWGAFTWRAESLVAHQVPSLAARHGKAATVLKAVLQAPVLAPLIAPVLTPKRIDLLASSDADRPTITAVAGYETAVSNAIVSFLVEQVGGWQMIECRTQEPGTPLHTAAHRSSSWRVRVRDIPLVPYTEVALRSSDTPEVMRWKDTGEYFSALSKRMRSNVSRQTRNLFAAGDVELIHATTPQATSALFDSYLDLEKRSWKANTDAGVERHPERVAFMREMVAGRAGLSPSMVGVLLDGELIAGLYNGAFGDRMWCQEMAFDEHYAHLGPGQLLLLLTIGDAISRRCRSVNFFQLHGYFKKRWLADEIAVVNVQMLRRPGPYDAKGVLGDVRRSIRAKGAGSAMRGEGDGAVDRSGPTDDQSEKAPGKLEVGFNPLKREVLAARRSLHAAASRDLIQTALPLAGAGVEVLSKADAGRVIPFSYLL
jgi:hypothetical protein